MTCPSCGHENPDHAKFCLEWASPFPIRCASCGTHLADKILQSKFALEGERKQVTVLFANVKGSIGLVLCVVTQDPAAWTTPTAQRTCSTAVSPSTC